MRTYKPSHRPDSRYIELENIGKTDIGAYLLGFFGTSGFGRIMFRPIRKDGNAETIRVERSSAREVAAALLCSKDRIKIKRISGTLASLARRKKKDE
jgi:RNase P/RNase MRP subunit POP5